MPLPPVPTDATDLAMPCAAILNHLVPAKRPPIHLAAFRATVFLQQVFQRRLFTAAWQLQFLFQLLLRKLFIFFDILNHANDQFFRIHTIQRIFAVHAAAFLITRLSILQADAPFINASGFALAVNRFFHFISLFHMQIPTFFPHNHDGLFQQRDHIIQDPANVNENPELWPDLYPQSSLARRGFSHGFYREDSGANSVAFSESIEME